MIFNQGDIITVDFNPTIGHEPQNERPALVVSSYDFNRTNSMTIVCPITRSNNGFYLHELLPSGHAVEGCIVMEQMRAIDLDARNATKIDQLKEDALKPILICLQSFFAFDEQSGT